MNRPLTPEEDVADDFEKDELTIRESINIKVSEIFLTEKSISNYCFDERFFENSNYIVVVGGEWNEGESNGACER